MEVTNKVDVGSLKAIMLESYKNHLVQNCRDEKQVKLALRLLRLTFNDFCVLVLLHYTYFCSVDFTAKSWNRKRTFIQKQLERFEDILLPHLKSNKEFVKLKACRECLITKSERDSLYGLNSVPSISMLLDISHKDLVTLAHLHTATEQEVDELFSKIDFCSKTLNDL